MSLHCAACDKGVEYGQDLCAECHEIVMEYNRDLTDQEDEDMPCEDQEGT